MSGIEHWPPSYDVEPGDVVETFHVATHFGSMPLGIRSFYEIMEVWDDHLVVRFDHLLIERPR